MRSYAKAALGIILVSVVMAAIGMILNLKASTDQGARDRARRQAINQTLRDARNPNWASSNNDVRTGKTIGEPIPNGPKKSLAVGPGDPDGTP